MNKPTLSGSFHGLTAHLFHPPGYHLKPFFLLIYYFLLTPFTVHAQVLELNAGQTNVSAFGRCDGSVVLTPSGGMAPYDMLTGIMHDFSGTTIDNAIFSYGNGAFLQNDNLSVQPGAYSYGWDNYLFTNQTSVRASGTYFQCRVKQGYNGYVMIGWHDEGTGSGYGDLVHAFYMASGYVYIYEDGNYREHIGYYPPETWYDIKIELLSEGARYYIKDANSASWDLVYTSDYSSESNLRFGLSMFGYADYYYYYSGGIQIDDLHISNNPPVSGLCPGTYTYYVKDAAGSEANASVTITEPSQLLFNAAATPVSCSGSSDGAILIEAAGGVPPYSYSIDGENTFHAANEFSGLPGNYYSVSVKDQTSIARQFIQLNEPDPLSFQAEKIDNLCYGEDQGRITLLASGGTGPYLYSFDDGASYQAGNELGHAAPGTYLLRIKDANNCVSEAQSVLIAQPAPFSVSAVAQPVSASEACDGSVVLTPSGGMQPYMMTGLVLNHHFNGSNMDQDLFSFGGGAFSQNNEMRMDGSPASYGWNNYLFTNEIVARTEGKVFQAKIKPDYNSHVMIGWHDAGAGPEYSNLVHALYMADGYLHIFEDGNYRGNVGYFQPGMWYDIKIELKSAGANYFIKQVNSSAWNLVYSSSYSSESNLRAGLSFYGSFDAYYYEYYGYFSNYYGGLSTDDWSVSADKQLVDGLCKGIYEYTVTDANGCEASVSVSILDVPNLSFSSSAVNVSCNGATDGSITVQVSGGAGPYAYSADNGVTFQASEVFNGLPAGSYSILVIDGLGTVSAPSSVNISQPDALLLAKEEKHNACHGDEQGVITLKGSGGTLPYYYAIDGGAYTPSGVFEGLAAGIYEVCIKDAAGCKTMSSVQITEPQELTSAVSAPAYLGYHIRCKGGSNGSINLQVSGGTPPYSYIWSGGQTIEDPSGLSAGAYAVVVTDAKGCQTGNSILLKEPASLAISAGADKRVFYGYAPKACMMLQATGISGGVAPYSILWSNGSANAAIQVCPSVTTTYTVTVTDANGCSFTDDVVVCVTDVRCGPKNDKVLVCHKSNQNAVSTLCVSLSSVAEHLAHGDVLGTCGAPQDCIPGARLAGLTDESVAEPESIRLEAWPNPFSDKLHIQVISPREIKGRLELIDMAGRRIALLHEGVFEAAVQYDFVYVAELLTPGVYFYKMETNEGAIVRRLIFIK